MLYKIYMAVAQGQGPKTCFDVQLELSFLFEDVFPTCTLCMRGRVCINLIL